jgi:hypothetical protein
MRATTSSPLSAARPVGRELLVSPRATGRPRPATIEATDLAFIRHELARVTVLANAGQLAEGREAIAELLFDFQALIAASPGPRSRVIDLLIRCDGSSLLRRFMTALYGDEPIETVSAARPTAPAASLARKPAVTAEAWRPEAVS